MYREKLEALQIHVEIKDDDTPQQKRARGTFKKYINKALRLQEIFEEFESGSVDRENLPYYPESIGEFCSWSDECYDLVSLHRPSFSSEKKDPDAHLNSEKIEVKHAVKELLNETGRLAKLLKRRSVTSENSTLRDEKSLLNKKNKVLASQLAEIRVENQRLELRILALETQVATKDNEIKSLRSVHTITDLGQG